MTPRTRTSNKDANYKVYYSKKIPQQVRFPHKTKIVRGPDPGRQDAEDKRQMKFLPEKMRQKSFQGQKDSEEEETEEEPTVQDAVPAKEEKRTLVHKEKGRKRKSFEVQEESATEDEPVASSSKRRTRTTAPKDKPSRNLRRQSTMTQLAHGRKPSFGDDGPDFKALRRYSRTSWVRASTGSERDTKQRTLTQMIPGMGQLTKEELKELSDLDADLGDTQSGAESISRSLIEQGLIEVDEPAIMRESIQRPTDVEEDLHKDREQIKDLGAAAPRQPSLVLHSVDTATDDDEDDYQPTQFIEAPILRKRQTPRRAATRQPSSNATGPGNSARSRFSLLSTPEKLRVFEIPSSQSPAESVLSTQISPQKSNRPILRERNSNAAVVTETPSKRRQVAFQESTVQPAPPAQLRRFESTIQDSEDEGSEFDDDIATQQLSGNTKEVFHGQHVGADTQAVLLQIDQACADQDADLHVNSRNSSDEPEEPLIRSQPYRPSPELGESWAPVIYDDDGPQFESYHSSRASAKSQSFRAADSSKQTLPVLDGVHGISQLDLTTQVALPVNDIISTPPMIQLEPEEELPSTPMVIKDESSDEEAEPKATPPRTVQRRVRAPPSTLVHQSTDLDGEPVQVPRSPSVDRETQQSHSSRAEQQLQNEWLSYSQYVHARAPNLSSMHATADAFSYNATPRFPRTGAHAASSARMQHSQATTVDELTPRKNRTQHVNSANTTPHRISKSQPFVSPEKPPTLFIPSSFPSPSRAAMEGWSSPVFARTQNVCGSSQVPGSLEDFSIPLPPPVEDD
ncbi:hypothetical protein E8E12_007013 [Didymella heteroderae]|uniref:Uncharacterized protein n=1 Tax=Didymella heteroderae TaxID=1769908 RepID=A0A9P4WSD3_9PLEO|nr:hypothetical protein E8E12_007013 [Didymella heteroderae]